ncbi:MAG: penicillin acylase family protein, partial [Acidobacteria bacterium]|nr:penicillin acylase family protein [Acidobacteriota bacterium]
MWKKLGLSGLLILLFSTSALFLAWREIRRSGMPQRTGSARFDGLREAVEVRFDEWGVPDIEADSLLDAVAAQGWLHANDRMTQMELGRRSAAGRLAEVVGEVALPLDRASRTLRLRETAEKLLTWASPESRSALEAYASGVNAWIRSRGKDLPPGLRLLRIEPEPWTPADSLSFVLLMASDLSFWQGRPEEERFAWLRAFGEEKLRDLLGEEDLQISGDLLELAEKPQPQAASAAMARSPTRDASAPPLLGSNGWVLGGSRTAGGVPLVANDPHLGLHLPSVWYQVLIRSPEYEAAGMSLPGLPGVVIGRSPDLAWAFTNTMLDDHDLYFEELDARGLEVRRGDSFVPLEVREEEIAVRGGDPVPLTLYTTDRGPLLPADPQRGLPPRSLAWTMYLPSDPLSAFLALARARTLDEVPVAVAGYVAPAQNLMVGHR